MKYMGSKRAMLQNGLGEIIRREAKRHVRIVDLFCGSASVSWFASRELEKPVVSVDLQEFARTLAQAVIERTRPLNSVAVESEWFERLEARLDISKVWHRARRFDSPRRWSADLVSKARTTCSESKGTGPIWKAYGGYYFSPSQAVVFDQLIRWLPKRNPERAACRASLIMAASKCAASPGHTAQPFANTKTGLPFVREAWLRNPIDHVRSGLKEVCRLHARIRGKAIRGDAVAVSRGLRESDLVFVDPPYSGVHYSRFYHVLETIARGTCGPVSGTGRYPPRSERPTSLFSQQQAAAKAMNSLFEALSDVGCSVLLTFPNHKCSNGLSGQSVMDIVDEYFRIQLHWVKTRFSTLGGNGKNRSARQLRDELILLLRPR